MNTISLTPDRLRVYKQLRAGESQSKVAEITGLRASMIYKATSYFVREGFLVEITKGTPRLYGPGPRANELDAIVVADNASNSASAELSPDATGVSVVSKESVRVATARLHHNLVRAKVLKQGDRTILRITQEDGSTAELPFLQDQPYLNNNTVEMRMGKVRFRGKVITVELKESPSASWFYIYLPAVDLTKEELSDKQQQDLVVAEAQEVGNYIQKHGGWRFGLWELTNWTPHYGCDDPRYMGKVIPKVSARSRSGKVWTSESEGRKELETSTAELAAVIVEMPELILDLRETVKELKLTSSETKLFLQDIVETLRNDVDNDRLTAEALALVADLATRKAERDLSDLNDPNKEGRTPL